MDSSHGKSEDLKRSNTANTVQKCQPLRSCVGSSILASPCLDVSPVYKRSISSSNPFLGLNICLSEICSQTQWFGTWFVEFFTFANCYGRQIRRKGLLLRPPRSFFFCPNTWLTKDRSERRGDCFPKAFAVSLLLRVFAVLSSFPFQLSLPERHGLKFREILFLAKLQFGHPIHVVLKPERSWLLRNKMLATSYLDSEIRKNL